MRYIGIDIGSSFSKAAVFDTGTCGALTEKVFPTATKKSLSDPRKFEIPAFDIVTGIKAVIGSFVKDYGIIGGIIFSTQMHGFVYKVPNREDTYISWQDSRCLNSMPGRKISFSDYLKTILSPQDMQSCGVYIKPSLGMCNLFTLLNSDEGLPIDGELFTLGSYIIYHLTGHNICHITNAAPLGLVNIATGKWDEEIISCLGFEKIRLPQIADSDLYICGHYEIGGQRIPVYPDFGDQQTAILGSMAGIKGIVINIATAGQISRTVTSFIPGSYEIRPYFDGGYINTISNMPSGRNLDVIIGFIKEIVLKICGMEVSTKDVWNNLLSGYQDIRRGLDVDMSFYATPASIDGGSITKITPDNFELNDLLTAAFINMAVSYKNAINALCHEKDSPERLVFTGGVSWKIPQLVSIISEVAGLPFCLSPTPDEVFAGLFRLSLVCSGICKSISDNLNITLRQ